MLFQDYDAGDSTTDGDISTCSETLIHNQTIWMGQLSALNDISAVRISVAGMAETNADITIKDDGTSVGRKCRTKSENLEITGKSTKTFTTYCPSNTVGKYVQIVFNNQSLRICEVSVLFQPVSSCLSPDIPLHGNGIMKSSGRTSTYKFKCHNGYELWGELLVTCQTGGRWFPKSPICQEIYCHIPDDFENGIVAYNITNGKVPYNGTARYTCEEDFYLEGNSTLTCHRWNTWDFPIPVCKPILLFNTPKSDGNPTSETWRQSDVTRCENLPHIENGALIVNSTNVGSIARLKCTEGFKPFNDEYTFCVATGKWSSLDLRCTIIQCEANPVIPHGKAILLDNSSYYGAHLEIICNHGYNSHIPIIRKCNEQETWGDLNTCVETSAKLCESNWTPSLILIAAIGAGAGTAILILCLFVTVFLIRKRRQSQTNSTIFHLEDIPHKDDVGQSNIPRHKRTSMARNCKIAVDSLHHSICTNPRKSHSALPNLPIDADPVYAQPFETGAAEKPISIVTVDKKDDLYNTHIYAEPIDSRRHTPTHIPNSITMSRIGNDLRLSTIKTNFVYESPASVQIDQQNCDKKCAIYDSSSNSTLNSAQFVNEEKYHRHDEKIESGTLNKFEYLELL